MICACGVAAGAVPGTVPEFEPPEQAPPGRPARPAEPTPGRPARPEEIPDPERDPLRTPERRRCLKPHENLKHLIATLMKIS